MKQQSGYNLFVPQSNSCLKNNPELQTDRTSDSLDTFAEKAQEVNQIVTVSTESFRLVKSANYSSQLIMTAKQPTTTNFK